MKQKRLEAICSFLNSQDSFIDVGCDHAYVAIEMAKSGCNNILATDIHSNALESAKKNITKENLQKKIKLQLTDGLEDIDTDLFDTIVIAGMGTSNIRNILKINKLSNINKIILQSNNDLPELREYMINLGYSLKEEIVVYEKKRFYVIMKITKGESSLTKAEILFGLYKKENLEYYLYLEEKLQSIKNNLPWNQWRKKRRLKKHLKILRKNFIEKRQDY